MNPDRESLSDHLAAIGTSLRGEAGQYLNNLATSFFRFVAKDRDETRPTRVGNTFCETRVPYQILYVEVLHSDESVPVDVPAGGFVEEIFPLTSALEVALRGDSCRFLTSIGAFLSPARLTLRFAQAFLAPLIVAWVIDRSALGVGKKALQAQIYANGWAGLKRRFRSYIAYDEGIPMVVSPAHEVDRFRSTLDRTMLLYLDASTKLFRNLERFGFLLQKSIVSFAVLPEMDRVPAIARFKPRETNLLPVFLTVKESPDGDVQAVTERLDRRLRDVLAATTLESASEIVPTQRIAALRVVALDQFEHFVVNKARFDETGEEQPLLCTVGIETIFEGFVHAPHCTEQQSRFISYSAAAALSRTVGEAA